MTQVQTIAANNAADAKEVKLVDKANAANTKAAEALAALEAYRADVAAEAARLNIVEGTEVGFTFGRGETKQDLRGKVIATVDTDHGRLLKVLAGEGASLKVYDVRAKDAVVDAPAEGSVEPVTSQPESDAVAEGLEGNDRAVEHDAAAAAVAQL